MTVHRIKQATTPIANVKKDRLGGMTSVADVVRFTFTGAARQKNFSTDAKLLLAAEVETLDDVSTHRYAK